MNTTSRKGVTKTRSNTNGDFAALGARKTLKNSNYILLGGGANSGASTDDLSDSDGLPL